MASINNAGRTSGNLCAVDGCRSSKRRNKDLSFFNLPADEERRREWLILIGREDLLRREDLRPTSYQVCSRHLQESSLVIIRKLQKDAMPTRCLPKQEQESTLDSNNRNNSNDASTQTEKVSKIKKRFPSTDGLKGIWIESINRHDWAPTKHTKICSLHFNSHDFITTEKGYRKLREGACPNLIKNSGYDVTTNGIKTLEPYNPGELLIFNDTPREKMLKGEIVQLRIKQKKDLLKIRRLQTNVRRLKKKVQNSPQASTSTAGAGNTRKRLNAEERGTTSLNSDSGDDERTEQDVGEPEQVVHYTGSEESQTGRLRLSCGGRSAGSLLPVTPAQSLQQELLMDLHEISDKIQNFYAIALGKQFTLTFKGEDGDRSEYVFTSASETRRSGERHSGLRCNECGSDIIGFRYKCVSCADYDLCSACEALGSHADHLMMRISKPLKLKQARSLLQRWCEAMKTAGVTTTEEITGAPGTTTPDTAAPVAGSICTSMLEVGPVNIKPIVITSKTVKAKMKTQKRESTQPPKTGVEAKKRKMSAGEGTKKHTIDASGNESSCEMPMPLKEEPLENKNLADFYSTFDETEPTVQVEDVKVEDPDPLSTDDIVENNMSSALSGRMAVYTPSAPPRRMAVVTPLAPPGRIAVGTPLAPSGRIAEDTSSAPPGPSQWTGISIRTYTHKKSAR